MAAVKFAYKTKYDGVMHEAFETFEVPDEELHRLEDSGAIVVTGAQIHDAPPANAEHPDVEKPKRKGKA